MRPRIVTNTLTPHTPLNLNLIKDAYKLPERRNNVTKETYLINEVAKEVHVESHVLRYWEEELDIPITRNQQGHRVYTQEDIERFVQIKNLKDQGLQLKAVKLVLNQLQESKDNEDSEENMKRDNPFLQKHETKISKGGEMNVIQIKEMKSLDKRESVSHNRKSDYRNELTVRKKEDMARKEQEQQEKLARMQYLIQKMIADAVRSNNQILINELSEQMKENICKEMDYQFRLLEEHEEEREAAREAREEERDRARRVAEEEHYKRIDNMLRERRLKIDKNKNKEKSKEPILFRALSKSKI